MPRTNVQASDAKSTNHLPKGWRMVRFDELAQSINERVNPSETDADVYVGLEHLDSETMKISRWGTPDDVIGDKLRFKKGDIIFGRRRAYQRKLAVAEVDGICSAHAMVVRANTDVVDLEFLPFLMQSDLFMNRAVEISVGSLSPTINWKTLRVQEFPLPPKDEQRRIAKILRAADTTLENWRTVLCDLAVSKRVTLAHMFHRGVMNEKQKDSVMGPVPESWDVIRLDRAAEFLDGKRVPIKDADRAKRKGPYPYYGASGIIDHIDDFLFDEPLILLSEDGFNLVHRNSPIAFKVEGKCWVNNHAHILRPNSQINIDLLTEYLESLPLEPYITGTYQRKLNKSACEVIPVPIPTEQEQKKMAGVLEAFRESLSLAALHVQASRELANQITAAFVRGEEHVQ